MITEQRKEYLTLMGYTIEDMGAVWGEEYAGQYRFLNYEEDDFGVIHFSPEAAWEDCDQYDKMLLREYPFSENYAPLQNLLVLVQDCGLPMVQAGPACRCVRYDYMDTHMSGGEPYSLWY